MQWHEILREYSREKTAGQYGKALVNAFYRGPDASVSEFDLGRPEGQQAALEMLMNNIESSDPTKNKAYVPWITREYIKGNIKRIEDLFATIQPMLVKFEQFKRKKEWPAEYKDIMRLDASTVWQAVQKFAPAEPEQSNKGASKEVFKGSNLRVIVPENEEAACYYGNGTKWCTAAKQNNMFDRYANDGSLYILNFKNLGGKFRKFQLHCESDQFMDEMDNDVGQDDIALLSADPEYTKFLGMLIKKYLGPHFQTGENKVSESRRRK
jgi:hypothetical protein